MASSSLSHSRNEAHAAFSGIESHGKQRRVYESSRLFDVFINHRGLDVKQTVALQLYKSLEELKIKTYLDSESKEFDDSFPSTIENAIHFVWVHIAIFSPGYAESPWCLAELVLMLGSRAKIIPLYYGVKPSDLRYIEKGAYAEAFTKYVEKRRYMEKLKEWKEALQSISLLTGYEISGNFNISECQYIVSVVQNELRRKLSLHVAKYPEGLHRLVEDFEKQHGANEGGKEKAQIVGIFGMGGIGKTTLAKELFNRKLPHYKRACFLFDVREAYANDRFPCLQSQLLKDLFTRDGLSFLCTEEGKNHLRDCIGRSNQLSFLLVVDDIDHVQQLDDLLIMEMLMKSVDSLVIATTRDVSLLINTGITTAYNLKGMDRNDASKMFCWHAFGLPHPASGYENLVNSFLNVCGGLPLSLKVLGSHVRGRDPIYWSSELNKFRKTLPRDIHHSLKISFDALDYEKQQIFMDIACFFVDESKSIAMEVWEASEWSAQHALETFKNKCLVQEIEKSFIGDRVGEKRVALRMHDHLRSLGREMADGLSHPRRLWRPQDLKKLESKGFQNTLAQTKARCFHSFIDKSMNCRVIYFLGESDISADTPTFLLWLKLEYIGVHFNLDHNKLQSCIPSWIPLQNLRCLIISNLRLKKLWHSGVQLPLQLRELRITQCFQVSSLPEEFCALQSLEILELSCCPMLSSLPSRFGDLRNLRHLDLSGCWKLKLRLDMLKNITKLEYLDLTRCHEVEELPHQITNQAYLTRLFVAGTSIKDIPTNIGELGNLEQLRIGSPMLTSLPSFLGNLSCLNSLVIDGCPQLEYLPPSVCLLDLLNQVKIRSSGLRELSFRAASSDLEDTGNQASDSACSLRPSVTEHGSLQTYFPNKLLARLETLSLVANPRLIEIRILPQSLTTLEIGVCKMLKNMSGIAGLLNLRRLEICSCPELDELPNFAGLASLQEFKIQGCPKVDIIQGLEHCTSLQILTAQLPLVLTCEMINPLKRCILSMQECPREMMIRGRARVVHFVEPIVDSLSLMNLTVLLLEKDSDWENIAQDFFNGAFLWYEEENESDKEESGSSGVKVVQVAVCRERSSAFPEYCAGRGIGSNRHAQRKAILAVGEDEKVVAAFNELIRLLE